MNQLRIQYCFWSLVFPLFLAGCLSELPPSVDSREYDANAKLTAVYNEIEGTYEGNLVDSPTGESDVPVSLKLFLVFEPIGVNEDGETKLVPALKGEYQRLDIEDVRAHYFISSVRFYKESGQIVLLSPEDRTSGRPGGGYLSITGTLIGDVLNGTLKDHRGLQGRLILEKILQ